MADNTNTEYLNIQVNTENGEIKINNITRSLKDARKEVNNFIKESKKGKKGFDDMSSSAGIAGATVSEFGRLVSDAPFGITAVTNNLSQLGSMFTILVQKTGSVNKAFKSLMQTLKRSPALLALLAFQAAVAALQFFENASKKAAKGQDDLAKAVGGAASELRIGLEALQDENVSLKEKNEIVDAINSQYKDMNLSLDEFGNLTEESVSAIDKQIEALTRLAEAQAIQKLIQAEQEKIAIANSKNASDSLSFWEKGLAVVQAGFNGTLNDINTTLTVAGQSVKNKSIEASKETIKGLTDQLKDKGLVDLLYTGNKKTSVKAKLAKVKKLVLDSVGTTIEQARKRAQEGESIIDKLLGAKPADFAESELKKNATEGLKTLYKQYIDPSIQLQKNVEAENYRDRIAGQKAFLDASLELQAGAFAFADSEFQRQLDMEQNKTTALNNELNKRLLDENISKDERRRIQNEIAKNDEKLRLKQEEIEKKRFKMQKAANIAQAMISTYTAAAEALKNGGGVPTGLPAMIATITTGLLQVASIARQKFVSSAGSAPQRGGVSGAGGSGGGIQPPDFNVVGASETNQLADVVGGQLSKPVKAYVVSKEVTTAQSMDRNIVKGASLG